MAKAKVYRTGDDAVALEHPEFVKELRTDELADFPQQKMLKGALDQVMWILWILQDRYRHHNPVSATQISQLLGIRHIALDEGNVKRAIYKAGRKISQTKDPSGSGVLVYNLMATGKDYMKATYPAAEINCYVLDGDKPWTDRYRTFPELAKSLKGEICVLDRYYGPDSFGTLSALTHGKPLRFLTAESKEDAKFRHELKDFQRQFPTFQAKLFPNKAELHDRYIITDDAVVMIGHGIKDMGRKESCIIVLKGQRGAEIRRTLQEKFEQRWLASGAF